MTQEQGTVNEYDPPQEFASRANVKDPAVYEEAAKDYESFWAGWARELHWFKDFDQASTG